MALISLLLLATLLPYLSHSASVDADVDVGIINGTEVKPHSRPYMVSIQENGHNICGGFLVSERYVISAAHCWEPGNKLTAVLGAHNLSDKREKSIRFNVESYYPHPEYNKTYKHDYDILLLKLKGTAKISATINWISLPSAEVKIPANQACSVAGWGRTGTNKPGSPRLREATVTTVSDEKCRELWKKYPTPRMVCAVHPGGDCQGDSGGPLVCDNKAVGIVSFGLKDCDKPTKPGVYAKVSAFLPWIKSIINHK